MEYGKIENGVLIYAPKNKGSISNFNLREDLLIIEGFLPVERLEKHQDNVKYIEKYKQENNKIVIFWEEQEISYQEKRLQEYPPLGDMVDAICKKLDGDSTDFERLQGIRMGIKAKYPKENSDE